ncbi:MAG: dethiobiotin synthase, partial [Myxococcales bacterium]|nr:dethiobiotin synthase [Myxococcales bacterium]
DTGQSEASASAALFPVPAAPLVSAEAAGTAVDPDALVAGFERLAARFPAVWVEGAGGLLVPIAEGFTYADLAARLRLPVLVVVGSRLGCLNHALLTLAELAHRGLPILGYVVNELPPAAGAGTAAPESAPHALATNRATLARFAHAPDLGALPAVPAHACSDLGHLASLAERSLCVTDVERALAGAERAA